MPQIVKKRRSGWAILAVGALVASLLAVGATPAAAIDEDSKPDHTVTATACLGPALADHGFTDISDAAVADINCLAYYGITSGRTADTFDPNSNVSREEMALFLSRAAGVMGADLSEGDMGADFGDIAELGDDRQSAIAALARNGIMGGRSDMAFDPLSDITRAEMAVALVSLVDKVSATVSKNDQGLFLFGAAPGALPNDSFADAFATVSQPVNNAISAAYELGITTGTGDGTTFTPRGTVPRRNMATFIVRALAHSNARPEGLTAQVTRTVGGDADITVSVRDVSRAAVVNQPIDVFYSPADQEDRVFKQDGTCSSRAKVVVGSGNERCEIDGNDPVTRSNGDVRVPQIGANVIGDGITVWVWTGDDRDKVSSSTDTVELSIGKSEAGASSADSAKISSDLALDGKAKAQYGTTVTFTIQLQGGTPAANAASPGDVAYNLKRETFNGTDLTVAALAVSNDPLEVNADGSATFYVTAGDLDPNSKGSVTVRFTLSRTTTGKAVSGSDPEVAAAATLVPGDAEEVDEPVNGVPTRVKSYMDTVEFSDIGSRVSAVVVEANSTQEAPGTGGTGGLTATVIVLNQYGAPMPDIPVVLTSSNPNTGAGDADGGSSMPGTARYTGDDGMVPIGYGYTGGSYVETVTATWNGDAADAQDSMCYDATDNDDGLDRCGTTTVFWVGAVLHTQTGDDADSATDDLPAAVDILNLDAEDGQIIVDTSAGDDVVPSSVKFDDNDFYQVDGSPATLEAFVETLTKALAAFEAAEDSEAEPTLAWSGYVYDDDSASSWFRLTSNLLTNDPPG